jgi:hypothetical protein
MDVFNAAMEGNAEAIDQLLQLGAAINAHDERGCTPMHKAAGDGQVNLIRALAVLGGDVNAPVTYNGWTPVHVAACVGRVNALRTMAVLGADVASRDFYSRTIAFVAALLGNIDALTTLVELGADINTPDQNGSTALLRVCRNGKVETMKFLVNNGSDVIQCMENETLGTAVNDIVNVFCQKSQLVNSPDMYALFSLTKLMTSMIPNDENDDEDDDNKALFEVAIAGAFSQHIALQTVQQSTEVKYPVKRRLCKLAWRVYKESLLMDGDRIGMSIKARRYVELVCLFLDKAMLTDVFSLRITCKVNSVIKRFPICQPTYRELEANLIESFIAYDASRFVSTNIVYSISAFHYRINSVDA